MTFRKVTRLHLESELPPPLGVRAFGKKTAQVQLDRARELLRPALLYRVNELPLRIRGEGVDV